MDWSTLSASRLSATASMASLRALRADGATCGEDAAEQPLGREALPYADVGSWCARKGDQARGKDEEEAALHSCPWPPKEGLAD
mmetsp:Transcript_61652/g.133510  ORF Transcript_61652/g.133510 Transcript_61652/m.133510 type:complete len:84 (-) Transcript_61652:538-789(-)